MLTDEIELSPSIDLSDVDRTLPLDHSLHARYRKLRRHRQQRVHLIGPQMRLFHSACCGSANPRNPVPNSRRYRVYGALRQRFGVNRTCYLRSHFVGFRLSAGCIVCPFRNVERFMKPRLRNDYRSCQILGVLWQRQRVFPLD